MTQIRNAVVIAASDTLKRNEYYCHIFIKAALLRNVSSVWDCMRRRAFATLTTKQALSQQVYIHYVQYVLLSACP